MIIPTEVRSAVQQAETLREENEMTDISFDAMMAVARQCLEIIRGIDQLMEDDAEVALTAGEPLAAIESVLDAAYGHPELVRLFPPEVRKMANDPEFIELEPFREHLNT